MVPPDRRIAEVLSLMEQNRSDPPSVSELARAVNLSPSYLRRLFTEELGQPPARFSKDARLEHARELLVSSFLSVKEIMVAVGWNDPSHFSRDFRRRFGISPRELRMIPRG